MGREEEERSYREGKVGKEKLRRWRWSVNGVNEREEEKENLGREGEGKYREKIGSG